MKFNLSFLLAQKPVSPLTDTNEISKQYEHWRSRIMHGIFIGYAIFYFCRKNLSVAVPGIIRDLGYSKTEIGIIWTLFYITYAVSRFISGILADHANPRYFMAIGLFISALMTFFFGLSSSLILFGVFWSLNGWFQGMGCPPCTRLLTQWYSQNERGMRWAIWSVAHQIGGGVILILGGILTQQYGWRSSFTIPALIAAITSFYLIHRLRDTPESLGLPSIEQYRNDYPDISSSTATGELKKYNLYQEILMNPKMWFLSIANFFVYIVRFGAIDWAPVFLVEVKHSSIAMASMKVAGFEFLGIAGAILAGWLSDHVFKKKRVIVNIIYMLLLAFVIAEFWFIPLGHPILDAIALSGVGFLVYGPQMLVGVSAADLVGKHAASTAVGFTGLIGYCGSGVSGIIVGWIVDRFGWEGAFHFFIISALLGGLCFFLAHEKTKNMSPAK